MMSDEILEIIAEKLYAGFHEARFGERKCLEL